MKVKKNQIVARVYAGRLMESFWERVMAGDFGGFHAETYMALLLRAKEVLRVGGSEVSTTYAELSRQCRMDYRSIKNDVSEMEKQGLITVERSGYTLTIHVNGMEAENVARGMGGRKKSAKNEGINPAKNVGKNDGHKEEKEKTKESPPTPPSKKVNKERDRKGASRLSSASLTMREGVENDGGAYAAAAAVERQQGARLCGDEGCNDVAAKGTGRTMEERARAFAETIRPYVEKYGADMCNKFYRTWTEPNQNGTKMRFEMERTWNVGIRLAKWNDHEGRLQKRWGNKPADPVADKVAADERERMRNDNEIKRLTSEVEALPMWAMNKLKAHGQFNAECTAAYALGFVRQLRLTGGLSVEELQLLERWEKRRKKAQDLLHKMQENGV